MLQFVQLKKRKHDLVKNWVRQNNIIMNALKTNIAVKQETLLEQRSGGGVVLRVILGNNENVDGPLQQNA